MMKIATLFLNFKPLKDIMVYNLRKKDYYGR